MWTRCDGTSHFVPPHHEKEDHRPSAFVQMSKGQTSFVRSLWNLVFFWVCARGSQPCVLNSHRWQFGSARWVYCKSRILFSWGGSSNKKMKRWMDASFWSIGIWTQNLLSWENCIRDVHDEGSVFLRRVWDPPLKGGQTLIMCIMWLHGCCRIP